MESYPPRSNIISSSRGSPLQLEGKREITDVAATSTTLSSATSVSDATFLLYDWSQFGLAERVSYHLDLMTMVTTDEEGEAATSTKVEVMDKIPVPRQHERRASCPTLRRKISTGSYLSVHSGSNNSDPALAYNNNVVGSSSSIEETNEELEEEQQPICGVVCLLEFCPPAVSSSSSSSTTAFNKSIRRNLRTRLRAFNSQASKDRDRMLQEKRIFYYNHYASTGEKNEEVHEKEEEEIQDNFFCYQPTNLPMPISSNTRVTFAYNKIRMVLCLDATPSLINTSLCWKQQHNNNTKQKNYWWDQHDNNNNSGSNTTSCSCCPLDLFPALVQRYLTGLVEPINLTNAAEWASSTWQIPDIFITVIASYSQQKQKCSPFSSNTPINSDCSDSSNISVLVRDYDIKDTESVNYLVSRIRDWASCEIESGIASRLNRSGGWQHPTPCLSHTSVVFDAGNITKTPSPISNSSSNLHRLLAPCEEALSRMSLTARPCITLVSMCSHNTQLNCENNTAIDYVTSPFLRDVPVHVLDLSSVQSLQDVVENPKGLAETEIKKYSDNNDGCRKSLAELCTLSGGYFLEISLLLDAIKTRVGEIATPDSRFSSDPYINGRRRSLRPNVLQWYTLFEVSHLSPLNRLAATKMTPEDSGDLPRPYSLSLDSSGRDHNVDGRNLGTAMPQVHDLPFDTKEKAQKIALSAYALSPIRLKGMLMLRFSEGFRAKRYSQNAQYREKLTVQLVLPIEGCKIHYELSFVSKFECAAVGSAHVKIGICGDSNLIQRVRSDLVWRASPLAEEGNRRSISPLCKASSQICRLLRWIRKEDCLQSYLCPMEWAIAEKTFFIHRLETLTNHQCQRHFRAETFEVIGICEFNEELHQDILAANLVCANFGISLLLDAMAAWATKVTTDGLYLKFLPAWRQKACLSYCFAKVLPCHRGSSLFSISFFSFGLNPYERGYVITSLKHHLSAVTNLAVLPKAITGMLLLDQGNVPTMQYYHSDSWVLAKDPELLPLVIRRRMVGKFWLVSLNNRQLLFVKFLRQTHPLNTKETLYTVKGEYLLLQCAVENRPDHLVISLCMEAESGRFAPRNRMQLHEDLLFTTICSKMKLLDQLYGNALLSRSRLLSIISTNQEAPYDPEMNALHAGDVATLIPYSSKFSTRLRFFKGGARMTNNLLSSLTEEYLVSGSLDFQIAKLSIDPETVICGTDQGTWFIIQRDSRSLTFAHFSTRDTEGEDGRIFRMVTYFTFCIGNFYFLKDEEETIPESCNQFLSEITMISECIEMEHNFNFLRAACLALRITIGSDEKITFDDDDFSFGLSYCSEVPVASAFIAQPAKTILKSLGSEGEILEPKRSVMDVIGELLRPVPGIPTCFFFCGLSDSDDRFTNDVADAIKSKIKRVEAVIDDESMASDQDDSSSSIETQADVDVDLDTETIDMHDHGLEKVSTLQPPPLFAKILLDGKEASSDCFHRIERGMTLTVLLTVFKGKKKEIFPLQNLPPLHNAVALTLRVKLEAFVAGQTLERLRYLGPSLSNSEVKVAMKCLADTDNVATTSVPLDFVFSSSESAVEKSSSRTHEEDPAFLLLVSELSSGKLLPTRRATHNTFIVTEYDEKHSCLLCWCLINVRNRDCVFISVHHPDGLHVAQTYAEKIVRIIKSIGTLVNQRLLLDSLHRTKIANSLLIPDDFSSRMQLESNFVSYQTNCNVEEKGPGSYGCPVVFSTNFPLNHRCTVNQVILSLESSVLHQFATNRKGVFVYRDENTNVFYMILRATKEAGKAGRCEEIELVVFGVESPGKSIFQLCRLLHKKVMTVAVENLSAVLAKNPYFSLLPADLAFIRTYKINADKLFEEDGKKIENIESSEYVFPSYVNDPLMMLLNFFQNICGSTFFHRLCEASDVKRSTEFQEPMQSSPHKLTDECDGVLVRYSSRFFSLFYNNTSTHLNPHFQSVSTLTYKGRSFSCQTGQGIALVNFYLLHCDGSPVEYVHLAPDIRPDEDILTVSLQDLTFQPVGTEENKGLYHLKVEVMNTTLDISYVHKWILLSLDQALLGWIVERHLAFSRKGILSPIKLKPEEWNKSKNLCQKWDSALEGVLPGLLPLISILEYGVSLPHPAVCKVQTNTLLRGCVARVALELLERAILAPIFGDGKKSLALNAQNIVLLRSTDLEKPHKVKLIRGRREDEIFVTDQRGRMIVDKKSLEVEYTIVFGLRCQNDDTFIDEESFGFVPASAKVFREVNIESSHGAEGRPAEFEARIAEIKASSRRKSAFVRSLAFILTVNRTSQNVLAYNWHPTVVQESQLKFLDIQRETEAFMCQSEKMLLHRCLRPAIQEGTQLLQQAKIVSNTGNNVQMKTTQKVTTDSSKHANLMVESNREEDRNFKAAIDQNEKKIVRPTLIRRPKLIGASVDGAVAQALLASRARASTRPVPVQKVASMGNKLLHSSSQRTSDSRLRYDSSDSLSTQENMAPLSSSKSSSNNLETESTQKNTSHHVAQVLFPNHSSSRSLRDQGSLTLVKGQRSSSTLPPPEVSVESLVVSPSDAPDGIRPARDDRKNQFIPLASKIFCEWFPFSPIPGKIPSHIMKEAVGRFASSGGGVNLLRATLPFAMEIKTVSTDIPTFILDKLEPRLNTETHSSAFLDMYLQYLLDDFYSVVSLSKESGCGNVGDATKSYSSSIFLAKEITSGPLKSTILLELFIKRSPVSSGLVASVKVWLFPLVRACDHKGMLKETLTHQEWKKRWKNQLFFEAFIRRSIARLGVESAALNYITSELRRLLLTKSNCDITSTLHRVYDRFPIKQQQKFQGLRYRLYRCRITWPILISAGDEAWVDFLSFLKLRQHNVENQSASICGAKHSPVLVGSLNDKTAIDVEVLYFTVMAKEILDIYVLIQADSHPLDSVAKWSEQVLQLRADHILGVVQDHIRRVFYCAFRQMRIDHLWIFFQLDFSSNREVVARNALSLKNVNELCEVAYSESILKPIAEAVFINEDCINQINWRQGVVCAMERDIQTFPWIRSWLTPKKSLVILARINGSPTNSLVIMLFDQGGHGVRDVKVLCKERDATSEHCNRPNVPSATFSLVPCFVKSETVRLLSDWLLHFIWKDLRVVEIPLSLDDKFKQRRIFPPAKQSYKHYTGDYVDGMHTMSFDSEDTL